MPPPTPGVAVVLSPAGAGYAALPPTPGATGEPVAGIEAVLVAVDDAVEVGPVTEGVATGSVVPQAIPAVF
jgi:hypothetical protein